MPGYPERVADHLRCLLKPKEAAGYLGLGVSRLAKMRLAGSGPVYLKLTRRAVRYSIENLDRWAAERAQRSTSDTRIVR